jgi:hypothetical protein
MSRRVIYHRLLSCSHSHLDSTDDIQSIPPHAHPVLPLSAVDSVRKDIESIFEPAVEEMRREVASMLIRLSSRVKGMKMADFLKECGGDVQALIAKDKRQLK